MIKNTYSLFSESMKKEEENAKQQEGGKSHSEHQEGLFLLGVLCTKNSP